MKKLFALVLLLTLFACTAPAQKMSAAQTVYVAMHAAYLSALDVAVTYHNLPACGGTAVVCRDADIAKRINDADDVAYIALMSAQRLVRDAGTGINAHTAIVTAQEAVAAFTAITSNLRTK